MIAAATGLHALEEVFELPNVAGERNSLHHVGISLIAIRAEAEAGLGDQRKHRGADLADLLLHLVDLAGHAPRAVEGDHDVEAVAAQRLNHPLEAAATGHPAASAHTHGAEI